MRWPKSNPPCALQGGKGTKGSEYQHLGQLQTRKDFDSCSKELQEHFKVQGPLQRGGQGAHPNVPTVQCSLQVQGIVWLDMETASCQMLGRATSYITSAFLFSLKVFQRANHSHSHFPEPSADYSEIKSPMDREDWYFKRETLERRLIIYQWL